MESFEYGNGVLHCCDCLEIMKKFPANHVTGIVTDAPYGLRFMGKKWDYDVPSVEMFTEMLRVLKPGGMLLCFAGSRTQHRMAVNIEDAGFILRDVIMWVYGSGFPKSYNIGKGVDKAQGNHRETIGEKRSGNTSKAFNDYEYRVDKGIYSTCGNYELTKGTSKWEGYGTALKPAYEPIIIAMKPLDGTFVDNALEHGVAGLNIDGCRIETEEKLSFGSRKLGDGNKYGKCNPTTKGTQNTQGRFPANIILDEEAGNAMDEQSGISKSTGGYANTKPTNADSEIYGFSKYPNMHKSGAHHNDSGGASRFFYCAKASKAERNRGCDNLEIKRPDERSSRGMGSFEEKGVQPQSNFHPTVKPLSLMKYLTKLVKMPENTLILDPFAGSGTTLIACIKNNIKFIGIEKEKKYFEIAKSRINHENSQLKLEI